MGHPVRSEVQPARSEAWPVIFSSMRLSWLVGWASGLAGCVSLGLSYWLARAQSWLAWSQALLAWSQAWLDGHVSIRYFSFPGIAKNGPYSIVVSPSERASNFKASKGTMS